ncbi:restriction endonuclease subunit S [Curtobacterium sp. MCLR17_058]|uniref:restriction endonuclease subunit S n=1 Tax=Curtobacterium sp. MCLR17_058 TaxID=2175635 RepID=UPI0015E8D0BC|nr:restriction endonuclease subunit S [Curtobacterium sp. MCLR17_058]WIB43993.1 restriction endonuclease subunit S [Curtobacterium sp. MCLR17_058]
MEITGNKVVLNLSGADNMRHVEAGDYVSHLRSFQGGLEYSGIPGKVSAAYTVLKPKVALEPRFFKYLFKSDLYIQALQTTTDQLRDGQSIRYGQFTLIPLPYPDLDEQRAIADYLDRETAQIDAFIAKSEELIALLVERRAAVLSAAMRADSGRMRLRQVLSVAQTGPFGTQLSASEYVDNGVPVINPSHIVHGAIAADVSVSVRADRAHQLSRFRLRAEDIVLGRKGEVDKAALVDEESDGYICGSDSMMLRPAKSMVHPKYLWWFLQSPPAHEQLERFAVGSTVAGLNQRTLRAVQLPVPSLDEQLTVTENLNRATAIIGHAMSIGKQNVKLAKERRAALISATVTGKINVGVAT